MATVTEFNRTNLRTLNAEIQAAVDAVAKKHGISIKLGNTRFQDDNFTTKVTATVLSTKSGSSLKPGQVEWNKYCWKFGLKDAQFGTTFTSNGTTFTVSGIKPKAKTYPILGTNANGTTYKFPASVLMGAGKGTRTII